MLKVVSLLLLLVLAIHAQNGDDASSGGEAPLEPDCSLKPEVGPCKALFWRYFYNATTQKCEQFAYGGCQGNTNNFVNLENCETACDGYVSAASFQQKTLQTGNTSGAVSLTTYYHLSSVTFLLLLAAVFFD